MPDKTVVFVCTGNICRSPMAEYALRDFLPDDTDWRVNSAGVSAGLGMPASIAGIAAMEELGIDMQAHRSQPLTRDLVDDSSLIVVMTSSHRNHVEMFFPGVAGKTFLLKSFLGERRDVDDPIGSSVSVYRAVRDEIRSTLPGLTDFMNELEDEK